MNRGILLISLLITLSTLIISSISLAAERPYSEVKTFFKGSSYQLDIHYLYGRKDGNTILIIGGIQGDEPGGYLAADTLTDLKLASGNLIIIPRTNLNAITRDIRGVGFDMNRLFLNNLDTKPVSENESDSFKAIRKIVETMSQADVFINLHDGYGFHKDKYINKFHNQNMFGQSVIIDDKTFNCNGKVIELEKIANKILAGANDKISDKNLHLHLFNTNTSNSNSKYSYMQKASTWYALTKLCIPAFAIEASKNTPSVQDRINHHLYAVQEFLKFYGIEYEISPKHIGDPKLEYAVINIGDKGVILKDKDVISIPSDESIEVLLVNSNYNNRVTVDILDYGNLNDLGKKININKNTSILFRKDNKIFAKIDIKISKSKNAVSEPIQSVNIKKEPTIHKKTIMLPKYIFSIQLNGESKIINSNGTLKIDKLTQLKLISVSKLNSNNHYKNMNIKINLKGWYPKLPKNNGDDRNILINIPNKRFLKRYSLEKNRNIYPVEAVLNEKTLTRFFIIF